VRSATIRTVVHLIDVDIDARFISVLDILKEQPRVAQLQMLHERVDTHTVERAPRTHKVTALLRSLLSTVIHDKLKDERLLCDQLQSALFVTIRQSSIRSRTADCSVVCTRVLLIIVVVLISDELWPWDVVVAGDLRARPLHVELNLWCLVECHKRVRVLLGEVILVDLLCPVGNVLVSLARKVLPAEHVRRPEGMLERRNMVKAIHKQIPAVFVEDGQLCVICLAVAGVFAGGLLRRATARVRLRLNVECELVGCLHVVAESIELRRGDADGGQFVCSVVFSVDDDARFAYADLVLGHCRLLATLVRHFFELRVDLHVVGLQVRVIEADEADDEILTLAGLLVLVLDPREDVVNFECASSAIVARRPALQIGEISMQKQRLKDRARGRENVSE
jgi:hypothetical protein